MFRHVSSAVRRYELPNAWPARRRRLGFAGLQLRPRWLLPESQVRLTPQRSKVKLGDFIQLRGGANENGRHPELFLSKADRTRLAGVELAADFYCFCISIVGDGNAANGRLRTIVGVSSPTGLVDFRRPLLFPVLPHSSLSSRAAHPRLGVLRSMAGISDLILRHEGNLAMRSAFLTTATALLICAGCESVPTRRTGVEAPKRNSAGPSLIAPPAAGALPSVKDSSRPATPQAEAPNITLSSHQSSIVPSGGPGQPVIEPLPAPNALPGKRPPAALTLESLEGMALASSPAMGEAAARIQSARGQFVQAGLPPNPTAGYVGSEIGNDGHAGQQGAFVGQEVVTAGKLRLGRAVALREIQVAERELAAMQLRVLTDVRMSYYEVLVAQRRLELTESLAQTGRRSVEATQSLLERKEVSQTELLQAKVEADTTQILVNNARLAHLGAWQRLATVVGQPEMSMQRVEGDPTRLPPPVKQEQALSQLFSESPELAAAYARVERARWALARARAQAVPNLDLMGSAQWDAASEYAIAGAQIGMPIPFVNRNQGGIQQARADVVAAEQAAAKLELALRKRLSAVYQRYSTAAQQSQKYAVDIVPNVQQALANTTEGYNAGEFNFLQQLTAQRTYFQTNLAYLDALEVYWSSSRELEGLLLTGSLESASQ